jgi:gliding motility-associated-like protein
MITGINGAGSRIVPVIVDCHTIGTDYGEFNPTLTCPAGAATKNYKTSWYRLDITGTDTLDVTVFINENTNAGPADIKYRMMTGNCGAMQEQSCVQDALTKNTYRCLAPGNSYYIQVFTPIITNSVSVTGTIDLNISAIVHKDPCLASNNCIAVANFTPQFDCTKDRDVKFTNFSTYGTDIQYDWDFGYNNQRSTAVSPSFFYPALTTDKTYTVKLTIKNTACNKQDQITQTVFVPARPSVSLGNDTSFCISGSVLKLDATSHTGSTYYWNNGSTQPAASFGSSGTYIAEVTYNGCKARDTVVVWVNPITKKALQVKALCNTPDVNLSAARGYGEFYTWSTGSSASNITVAQTGYYWVDIYLNGCYIRDSFLVASGDLHVLGNDTLICQASMPLTLNPAVSGATYSWQDNSTSATFKITTPGTYWVDIKLAGCTFRDSLILTVDPFQTNSISASICPGQLYTLPSGKTVNTPGLYRDSLKNRRGCDSIITAVTISLATAVKKDSIAAYLCGSQSYTLPNGTEVNTPGIYREILKNTAGCDSLERIINLLSKPVIRKDSTASICAGGFFLLPSGKSVNTSGTYPDTLRYKAGCDSIIYKIVLTVIPAITRSSAVTICKDKTYILPSGRSVNTNGVYNDTLRYISGCDSLINIITLSVQNPTIISSNASFCEGLSFTLPWGEITNQPGQYSDTLYYTTGCDSLIRIIQLKEQKVTNMTITETFCADGSFTLPWATVVNTPGTYTKTYQYTTGCDSLIMTVNLSVQNNPVTEMRDIVICAGKNYILPSGQVIDAPGIYQHTYKYTTGCDSVFATFNISVQFPAFKQQAATICVGNSYILPSGKAITQTGTYTDTLNYTTGCDSIITTTTLTVKKPAVNTTDATICADSSYLLPWGGRINKTGIYNDTIRGALGCDSIINRIRLTVNPHPELNIIKSNDVDCMTNIAYLKVIGNHTYHWWPGESLSHTSGNTITASPAATTTYYVKAISKENCIREDSVEVIVYKSEIQNGYLMPNAFTPNNDGVNDCYGVKTWGALKELKLSIYSRWGDLLFQTTNPDQCWDGKHKGVEQSTGGYIYVVSATTLCGKVVRKGIFMLVR